MRSKFKRCFISAPFGTNTGVIRHALEAEGVQWSDQTSVNAGNSWLDVLEQEVARSDFVCAIVPSEGHGNIFFELGIAYSKGKPILAFISPSLEMPSGMHSLTYVRSDPTDSALVRVALRTFLEHAEPRVLSKKRSRSRSTVSNSSRSPARYLNQGRDFEDRTAALLARAGFIVSEQNKQHDVGADFAVWIDQLEHSLGNPVLVEVKAGHLSSARLNQAASQLRKHVERTRGRWALLVYWDDDGREFSPRSFEWPLVLFLSGKKLSRLVTRGELVKELVKLRNLAVHGGS